MIKDKTILIEETKKILKQLFSNIHFSEEKRKNIQTSSGEILHSVSSKYKKFEVPFDPSIAKFIAPKMGLSEQELLAQWKAKGDKAAEEGKSIHKFSEDYILLEQKIEPSNDKEKGIVEFFKDHLQYIVIAQELTIYHVGLKYMGILDLLVYDIENEEFIIIDWKTNEDLFKNYKKKTLLEPFTDYLQCPLNLYKIQLNLYDMCFEEAGFPIEKRLVVWLSKDGITNKNYRLFEVEDLKLKLKNYYANNS